jgi:hypothetical protein
MRQNVRDNDVLLLELAIYKASKGQTVMLENPEIIQSTFTELKTLVQRGTFSMEALEKDILSRHGIVDDCPRAVEITPMIAEMLGLPTSPRGKRDNKGKPQIGFHQEEDEDMS